MKTIWKYELQITDVQRVPLPAKAIIQSVAVQRDTICLWATVDTELPVEPRKILLVGTGHDTKHCLGLQFVGTVVMEPFVWHVFADYYPDFVGH